MCLNNFNLPIKTRQYKNYYTNRLIEEEIAYNILELEEKANRLYNQLNNEQKNAFHAIVNSALQNNLSFYFVSGYGGTGKTFLWNIYLSRAILQFH